MSWYDPYGTGWSQTLGLTSKKKKGPSKWTKQQWSGMGLNPKHVDLFSQPGQARSILQGFSLSRGIMGELEPSLDQAEQQHQGALGAIKQLPGIVNQGADAQQGQVGAIGVAGYRRAKEGGQQMSADIAQTLSQRGLQSSTIAASASRAVNADVQRQNQDTDANMAGIRASIEQFRTQGLQQAQLSQAQGMGALADFYMQKSQMNQSALMGSLGIGQDALGRKDAQDASKNAALGQAAAAVGTVAMMGGCCFIMLEARYGDGTMDRVARRYRDEHMTERNRRGYYKLADVLVPLMRASKVVRWLVRVGMTSPLVSYGKWHYGEGRVGRLLAPVARGWLKLFDYLGGEHPFIRENGETV